LRSSRSRATRHARHGISRAGRTTRRALAMRKPVVGVIGSAHVINDVYHVQSAGRRSLMAVAEVAGALPLMFAGTPDITDIDTLLSTVDGILLTGARANVHPSRFADRHEVRFHAGGVFAQLFGCDTIRVNSLHGQGILEPGQRIVVEGVADDGTIEAIRVADAPSFALGVQWHAEHDPQTNSCNRILFEAFGAALVSYKRTSG